MAVDVTSFFFYNCIVGNALATHLLQYIIGENVSIFLRYDAAIFNARNRDNEIKGLNDYLVHNLLNTIRSDEYFITTGYNRIVL